MSNPEPEPPRNQHPADELADIRLQLRPLVQRADKLRLQLIKMPEGERRGDSWHARVTDYKTTRLNRKALQKTLGIEALRPFLSAKSHKRMLLIKNRKEK